MIPLPVTHSPFGERHTKITQRPTSQCKIIFLPESIAWIAHLDFQVHVREGQSLRWTVFFCHMIVNLKAIRSSVLTNL